MSASDELVAGQKYPYVKIERLHLVTRAPTEVSASSGVSDCSSNHSGSSIKLRARKMSTDVTEPKSREGSESRTSSSAKDTSRDRGSSKSLTPLNISDPQCVKCQSKKSDFWLKLDSGDVECNACQVAEALQQQDAGGGNKASMQEGSGITGSSRMPLRKSTRNTRSTKTKQNPYAYPRPVATKGKGRRSMFKKTSYKAPTSVATPVTKDYVFFKGSYIQVGDIVSMRDVGGGIFYAQIRGLLQDQYCEKSAVITWLLPSTSSPPPEEGFDPTSYTIGMEEDLPRKLDCMEFVMHAPSDYFRALNAPYPTIGRQPEAGFIWTSLRSSITSTNQ